MYSILQEYALPTNNVFKCICGMYSMQCPYLIHNSELKEDKFTSKHKALFRIQKSPMLCQTCIYPFGMGCALDLPMVLGYVFRYTKSNTRIVVILLRHSEALGNVLVSMVFKMAFPKPEKEWVIVVA